jgi:DegV family protein with EDD domain
MPVCVVTDSVASIPDDLLASNGIDVVSLFINDGETNQAELDMDVEAFYRRLEDMRKLPTSSQPSVESMLSAFRRGLQRDYDVLGIFISQDMSGTVQTARMAADMLAEEYPDGRIEVLDSRSNSMQEGYGVLAAAAEAKTGASIERCIAAASETLRRTRYLFTPHTLEYLRRGGRIGGASALIGGLLQIKPILTVEEGETQTFARVRTQSRALAEMTRKFSEDTRAFGLAKVCVHYISDAETAETYAREQIEPLAGEAVRVIPVSPVIGLHVGPAVAIVYTTERDWT